MLIHYFGYYFLVNRKKQPLKENVFHIAVLQAEALTAFILNYLFKEVCIVTSLEGNRECLPPKQR